MRFDEIPDPLTGFGEAFRKALLIEGVVVALIVVAVLVLK